MENLLYTKEHEWIKLNNNLAEIGITQFAQSELGEIVFVDLPSIGKEFKIGDVFCVVESTKAASDVYAPLSGKIVEVNSLLSSNPEMLNSQPYNSWIVKIEVNDLSEVSKLISYKNYCELIGA